MTSEDSCPFCNPSLLDLGDLLPTPRVAAGGETWESWWRRNAKLARERPKGASGVPLETVILALHEHNQEHGD